MFTPEQIDQLSAKLDKSHVKERMQAGRKLSYVEGWHAIAEANRIFGFDAWTRETLDIRVVSEAPRKIGRDNPRDGWGVSYIAKVRVIVDGVAREGIGAGHGIDVDLGLAHESAVKEAETDAMKRALMTFGNPFGLALYDKTQENVETHSAPPRAESSRAATAPSAARPAVPLSAAEQIAKIKTFDLVSDMLAWANSDAVDSAYRALSPADQTKVSDAFNARQAQIEDTPFAEAAE